LAWRSRKAAASRSLSAADQTEPPHGKPNTRGTKVPYRDLKRLEVRMMYVGQGMANVVCGYVDNKPDKDLLSFLMVCDFGSERGSSEGEIGLSVNELKALMKQRVEDEIKLKSRPGGNQGVPGWDDKITAYIDVFVLSHADQDHYILLYKLTKDTKIFAKDIGGVKSKTKPMPLKPDMYSGGIITGEYIEGSLTYIERTNGIKPKYQFFECHSWNICSSLPCITLNITHDCILDGGSPDDHLLKDHTLNLSLYRNDELFFSMEVLDFKCDDSYKDACFIISECHFLIYGTSLKNRKVHDNLIHITRNTKYTYIMYNIYIGRYKPDIFSVADFKCFSAFLAQVINMLLRKSPSLFKKKYRSYLSMTAANFRKNDYMKTLDFDMTREKIECELNSSKCLYTDTMTNNEPDKIFGFEPYKDADLFKIGTFVKHVTDTQKDKPPALQILSGKAVYEISAPGGSVFPFPPPPQPLRSSPPPLPGGLSVDIIAPIYGYLDLTNFLDVVKDRHPKRNMHSQTTVVTFDRKKFVFPGDPTAHTMYWMSNTDGPVSNAIKESDVLSAPHHGSSRTAMGKEKSSSGDSFSILEKYLKLINPEYHIISSDPRGNNFCHPKYGYVENAKITPRLKCAEYTHQICKESSCESKLMIFENELKSLYTTVATRVNDPSLFRHFVDKSPNKEYVSYMFELDATPSIDFKIYPPKHADVPYTPALLTPPAQPRLSFSQFIHEHKGGSLWA
jgi:hypothetical protein